MVVTAAQFVGKLEERKSALELKKYERYFPVTQRGDDQFMGVRMGEVFSLAKEFVSMSLDEVDKLLESPVHEVRVGAVSIMDFQARSKKSSEEHRKELFDLYIRRHDRINTWDLVDRSAIYVVGSYLANKPRDILYQLAHSKMMAERRTAIVSTAYFMMKLGETADTFKLAKLLLADKDDLIHKAVGWMLRVAGDKDKEALISFLDEHASAMPRVMLRYATEKLSPEIRSQYVGK